MENQSSRRFLSWRLGLFVFGVAILSVVFFRITAAAISTVPPPPQQDVMRLENRVTQLEQRLYSLETNVRTLEQMNRTGLTSRGVSPEEVALLRAEVQTLQNRMADYECFLERLDERTLSRETRELRKRSGIGSTDPCRANVDAPLPLRSSGNQ